MTFSPELAAIRFGCGLSPDLVPAADASAILDGLAGPDRMAGAFPIPRFTDTLPRIGELREMQKGFRKADDPEAARKAYRKELQASKADAAAWLMQVILRQSQSDTAFRERLVSFWADHFSARGKSPVMKPFSVTYVEEAIRPHVAGSFGDLLVAAVSHPMMLHYLDQVGSIGPKSRRAERKAKGDGLNENLAREVMELHTLGVGGPYSQDDVRQLAELFTGMTFNRTDGFRFNPAMSEPGAETVLGKSYGGRRGDFADVEAALRDIAVHPATAKHIAWKLSVHFVADEPDPDLLEHVTAAYVASGGNLIAVYSALLEHPASWRSALGNVKPPLDFIGSSARALGFGPAQAQAMKPRDMRRNLLQPLARMGQPWQLFDGPDGWPEEDQAWLTPQSLAVRMLWAVGAPQTMVGDLPDPAGFAEAALGPYITESVRFAARAAESRAEAVGLVLSSPSFQRR